MNDTYNCPEVFTPVCGVGGFVFGLVCGPFIAGAITQSWDYAFVGTLAGMAVGTFVGIVVGGVASGVAAWKEECRRQELYFR